MVLLVWGWRLNTGGTYLWIRWLLGGEVRSCFDVTGEGACWCVWCILRNLDYLMHIKYTHKLSLWTNLSFIAFRNVWNCMYINGQTNIYYILYIHWCRVTLLCISFMHTVYYSIHIDFIIINIWFIISFYIQN